MRLSRRGHGREGQSRGRSSSRAVNLLAAVAMLAFAMTPVAALAAPKVASEEATVGMPFSGNFANAALPYTYPDQHSIGIRGSAWSTDLYAPGGTPVVPSATSSTGIVSMKVTSPPKREACGTRVHVEVKVDGEPVGTLIYAHLVDVPKLKGKAANLVPGVTSIGRIARHGVDDVGWASWCWQVSTALGVHTHFEVAPAKGASACYARARQGVLPDGRNEDWRTGRYGSIRYPSTVPSRSIPATTTYQPPGPRPRLSGGMGHLSGWAFGDTHGSDPARDRLRRHTLCRMPSGKRLRLGRCRFRLLSLHQRQSRRGDEYPVLVRRA